MNCSERGTMGVDMARKSRAKSAQPVVISDTIDYTLTEHVELFAITQLKRDIKYRTWFTATWQEAVKSAMAMGMGQPKKVYSWRNLRYVEVENSDG
jgi:hypothetical protein